MAESDIRKETAGLKRSFPFRLGAPSYVLPGDLAANVTQLAPLVDDVQLLFFESAAGCGLAHPVPLALLHDLAARFDLTYTVHLPTDIRLADPAAGIRQQGIDEILRLTEELAPLAPLAFDLHLARPGDAPDWCRRLDQSLSRLATRLGPALSRRLAVENIDYPFELVRDLVRTHGFSCCLDFGHVVHYGHAWPSAAQLLTETVHIHYHGVAEGRDHQPLTPAQGELTSRLLAGLREAGYTGVLTLEIYNLEHFIASARILAESMISITEE